MNMKYKSASPYSYVYTAVKWHGKYRQFIYITVIATYMYNVCSVVCQIFVDDYCCGPKLVAPYNDYYGKPKGSNIQAFGDCQVQAAVIVDYGGCTNDNRYFR